MSQDLYFTQAGMDCVLRRFCQYQNDIANTLNSVMGTEYIRGDFDSKTAVFAFDVTQWMRNPGGVMHGGALSAALDIAMGSCTCYWAGCRLTPTVTLQMNFLRPIPVGSRLILECRVHSCGRTTAYATAFGYIEGREDKSVVTANGVYHVPASEDSLLSDVLSAAMAEIS